jgi:hypothetical protein
MFILVPGGIKASFSAAWERRAMFKTAGAAAFFKAWREICENGPLPHFRVAFVMSADIIPRLMILEATPEEKHIIRFMGTSRTEMWGVDLTGRDSLGLMPHAVAAAARRNLAAMWEHPCGLHHTAYYVTPSGREIEMENITVPVANDPGLPRRHLNFTEELATVAYSDPAGEVRAVIRRAWLDIGAGIPKMPPAQ